VTYAFPTMQRISRWNLLLIAAAACTAAEPSGIEDAASDASGGKSDSGGIVEGSPEAIGVLYVANHATFEQLTGSSGAGISRRAARNIIAVRAGDDEVEGTPDDEQFDSIDELDRVPFVGPRVFAALLEFAIREGHVPTGWIEEAPRFQFPQWEATAVAAADGTIVVFGSGSINVEQLAPTASAWAHLHRDIRSLGSAARGADGGIYLIGVDGMPNGDRVRRYDPSSATVEILPGARPLSVFRGRAVTGPDARIYALGGIVDTEDENEEHHTTAVDSFSPADSSWRPAAPMAHARASFGAAVGGDGRIYVAGGFDEQFEPMASVEAYDIATDTWTEVAPLPEALHGLGMTSDRAGNIYVVGGQLANGHPTAHVWIYAPASGTWTAGPSLHQARYDHSTTTGLDGSIYAISGQGENAALTSYERLAP